jgi:hypothetical protein
MNRPEARAVCWHNDRRGKRGPCIAGLLDQRFGGQATEVEPADDGIDLLDAGQILGIAHGIDNTGMTTTDQDHQPFVPHMQQHGLIIENEWVPFPLAAAQCLLPWHATLECCGPVDLSCHQERSIE